MCQDDLNEMYESLRSSKEIFLWSDGKGASDVRGSTPVQKNAKKHKLETQLIDETEDKLKSIVKRLKEKHENAYSGPQYRLWGRMIASGSHDDEDDPPKVRVITGIEPRKQKKRTFVWCDSWCCDRHC